MPDDTPLLDTLAAMTAASLENSSLEPRELMLARIAALAASDAPPLSYLVNAGTAVDAGITLADVQGVLVAIAPIVGTARTVSAAGGRSRLTLSSALGHCLRHAVGEQLPNGEADGHRDRAGDVDRPSGGVEVIHE